MGEETDLISLPDHSEIILNSLSDALISLDDDNQITYINAAAELLLGNSAKILTRKKLEDIVPFDSPLVALVRQVRGQKAVISEYDINIGNPNIGELNIDVHVSSLMDDNDGILIQLQQRTIAQKISQQQNHRNASRSVSGMAAMLAHEVKNPLSGIRGAAQLLEQTMNG